MWPKTLNNQSFSLNRQHSSNQITIRVTAVHFAMKVSKYISITMNKYWNVKTFTFSAGQGSAGVARSAPAHCTCSCTGPAEGGGRPCCWAPWTQQSWPRGLESGHPWGLCKTKKCFLPPTYTNIKTMWFMNSWVIWVFSHFYSHTFGAACNNTTL